MAKIWKQKCKVCGQEFGYSDFVLRQEILRGYSRPERCPACRAAHGKDIDKIAFPFFTLKPRQKPFPILGVPYLGRVSDKTRTSPILESIEPQPHQMKIRISEKSIQELYHALEKHQVVIIEGSTGCGKSTYIPYRLIEPLEGYFRDHFTKNGPIIITQPRIPPTKGIPLAMSEKFLGSPVGAGYEVGYRFRGAETRDIYGRKIKNYDRYNRIIYVTDGTLLNWIQAGKLGQYSIIIIDEAHERSQNIDLILSFLKRELPKYPHLKLIISSATIDTQSFIDAFKDVTEPYLLKLPEQRDISEKNLGYEVIYNKTPVPEKEIPEALGNKILEILEKTEEGGILGFLHGEAEIKRAIEQISKSSNFKKIADHQFIPDAILGYIKGKEESSLAWIFPCYRDIGEEKINQEILKNKLDPVFLNGKKIVPRRVVIATNIAETSLTVPDAVYVVDSGMIKQPEWDRESRTTRLVSKRHSQDGCKQRWGRVGRVKRGVVYTLYTKEEFENFDKHTLPEIARSCLETPVLILKTFGISNPTQFPWIIQSSEEFKSELERVNKLLYERGIIDKDGDITENGVEIWKIQRLIQSDTLDDASLLILADRFGCFPEALLALKFRSLMGVNLYHPDGLFKWDSNWDARTKAFVARIHDGLKIGCRDDLAFLMKIFICYQKAEKKGEGSLWCNRFFINEEVIIKTLEEMEDIFEYFSQEMKVRKEINPSLLEKLRFIMAIAWPDRIVEINQNNSRLFKFKKDFCGSNIGIISQFSAGDWKNEKKAICGATSKELVIIEGEKKIVPSSCFMVKMPKQIKDIESISPTSLLFLIQETKKEQIKEMSFLDQKFPIGSKVKVEESDGKVNIIDILEFHPQIQINYREPEIEEETQSYREEFLGAEKESETRNKRCKKAEKKKIGFGLIEDYSQISEIAQAIWSGNEKQSSARIIEWIEKEGKIFGVLTPFDEADIAQNLSNKTVKVTIQSVERDRRIQEERNPYTKQGWIIARTPEGVDIPVEFSEITLSPLGYGLETLIGSKIELSVKSIDRVKGKVQLSNIDEVIKDLRNLYKRAQKGETICLSGYVVDINEEKQNVTIAVPREFGVVHSFEIYKDFVPKQDINSLRIGEKCTLRLTPRAYDKISWELLKKAGVKDIPKNWQKKWNTEKQEEEIHFPCCLEDQDLECWQVPENVKELVKKHSWQFCFGAKIQETEAYEDPYKIIQQGMRVKGKVIKILEPSNTILIEIDLPEGAYPIEGRLPLKEISWKSIEAPLEVVKIGEIIDVKIINLNFPPVIVSRKQSFVAEASIPFVMIPVLIGRGGCNIKALINDKDVNIHIDRVLGKVVVKAPSSSIRDYICERISSQIRGMGKWKKD